MLRFKVAALELAFIHVTPDRVDVVARRCKWEPAAYLMPRAKPLCAALSCPGRLVRLRPKATGSSPAIRSAEEFAIGVSLNSFNAQSQRKCFATTVAGLACDKSRLRPYSLEERREKKKKGKRKENLGLRRAVAKAAVSQRHRAARIGLRRTSVR